MNQSLYISLQLFKRKCLLLITESLFHASIILGRHQGLFSWFTCMYVYYVHMYYALDIRSGDSHNIQVKTVIKDDILLGSKKFSPPLVQSESIYIFVHYGTIYYSHYIQKQFSAILNLKKESGGNFRTPLSRPELQSRPRREKSGQGKFG